MKTRIVKSLSVTGWKGKTYFRIENLQGINILDIEQRMLVPTWWESDDRVLKVFKDYKLIERVIILKLDTVLEWVTLFLDQDVHDL
jgi:hypothetical protein